MATKFVVKVARDGQFYFNLKAGNGETILSSELYKTKASALNGVESVKKNAPYDSRYEIKKDAKGNWRFNLLAANGQVIGVSESYSSEAAMRRGIASVKENAPGATVEEPYGPGSTTTIRRGGE